MQLHSMSYMKKVYDGFLNLIFPKYAICPGCNSKQGVLEGSKFCSECNKNVNKHSLQICNSCENLILGDSCAICNDWATLGISFAGAPYSHTGTMRELIHKIKYNGMFSYVDLVSDDLTDIVHRLIDGGIRIDCLIPVPLFKTRLISRGFNQAKKIAEAVSIRTEIRVDDALIRIRDTPTQTHLSFDLRQKNLEQAFCTNKMFTQINALLIDDVLTSGATAIECAKALKKAGANWVGILTITRADKL